jgi:methionyl-tRNA formyltransferase
MKAVFIGSVESSYRLLSHILQHKLITIVGVVTRDTAGPNSDFQSLQGLAKNHGIPCHLAHGGNQHDLAPWVGALEPDVIFCIGWSQLLAADVLTIPPRGVIGYHPSPLPVGRGRHPIIWPLVLGLSETASSFLLLDEGVDSGDLVSQISLPITMQDDAASLYTRLLDAACGQINDICKSLNAGMLIRIPQAHDQATYWPKRGREDGAIDWQQSAMTVYNLVRALTKPYVGAHCVVKDRDVKVWACKLSDSTENAEPGRVLEIDRSGAVIKCSEGSVVINEPALLALIREGDVL